MLTFGLTFDGTNGTNYESYELRMVTNGTNKN